MTAASVWTPSTGMIRPASRAISASRVGESPSAISPALRATTTAYRNSSGKSWYAARATRSAWLENRLCSSACTKLPRARSSARSMPRTRSSSVPTMVAACSTTTRWAARSCSCGGSLLSTSTTQPSRRSASSIGATTAVTRCSSISTVNRDALVRVVGALLLLGQLLVDRTQRGTERGRVQPVVGPLVEGDQPQVGGHDRDRAVAEPGHPGAQCVHPGAAVQLLGQGGVHLLGVEQHVALVRQREPGHHLGERPHGHRLRHLEHDRRLVRRRRPSAPRSRRARTPPAHPPSRAPPPPSRSSSPSVAATATPARSW